MNRLTMPDGTDVVFENMEAGDEDFFSEQCGHINISMAYRELKRVCAPIIQCHVPRNEIPRYRQLRDIDPRHVERLKLQWPKPRLRPVLLGELEPGNLTLIDGVHRLIASAEMELLVDPIQLRAYVVPHQCLPLLKIAVYHIHPDGRREVIDTRRYMKEIWGKYTEPTPGGRNDG